MQSFICSFIHTLFVNTVQLTSTRSPIPLLLCAVTGDTLRELQSNSASTYLCGATWLTKLYAAVPGAVYACRWPCCSWVATFGQDYCWSTAGSTRSIGCLDSLLPAGHSSSCRGSQALPSSNEHWVHVRVSSSVSYSGLYAGSVRLPCACT